MTMIRFLKKELLFAYAENISSSFLVKRSFRKYYGYELPLEKPQTHTEKIFRRKVQYTPLMSRLADKIAVRDYVAREIGTKYLVPVYGVSKRLTKEIYDTLPERYVMKANHGCGFTRIIDRKDDTSYEEMKDLSDGWLKSRFHRHLLEFHYKNIPPELIIEKRLLNANGTEPVEYKCSYFDNNGAPVIYVHVLNKDGSALSIFDEEWNYLNARFMKPVSDSPPQKPPHLNTLLKLTRKLAAPFAHVRVDFLEEDGQLYFGELTFTPCSGLNELGSDEVNYEWGQLWGDQKAW